MDHEPVLAIHQHQSSEQAVPADLIAFDATGKPQGCNARSGPIDDAALGRPVG
jgi:hypothetical protein